MRANNTKQRLFEVMGKLDNTFKSKLNEDDKWIQNAVNPEHKGYCTPMTKDTCTPKRKALAKRFKQGIDEFYEDNYQDNHVDPISAAKSKARSSDDYNTQIYNDAVEYVGGIDAWNAMNDNEKDEIYRLVEPNMSETYGTPDPLGSNKAKQMNEMSKWGVNKANPKYTHFAVLKDTGKIVNGWEYSGYDQAELRQYKKDYFFQDIQDMQINPKIVNIVTAKYLQKKGIDPYDFKNWHKNDIDGTDIFTM